MDVWLTAAVVAAAALALAALRLLPDTINRARHAALARRLAVTAPGVADPRQGIVLMPVCGRPDYLRQVLERLRACEGIERHWIVFSQDGRNAAVSDLIREWRKSHPASMHMVHARPYFALPNLLGGLGLRREYLISANVYSLLRLAFDRLGADWVIVLEDDLVPARDFLSFFRTAHEQLLSARSADDRMLAVCGWSNWNFSRSVADAEADPDLLYEVRLTRFNSWAWAIDKRRWPLAQTIWWTYFVAWDGAFQRLRERTGLLCATPLISRVRNIGMQGVNFREAPDRPGLRWRTQSMLGEATALRFDPQRRLRTEFLAPETVTFIDGAPVA